MYKLESNELENVRGGSKAGAVVKGVKVGYGVLAKGVEVAGVLAATADLAYRGYKWARGR
jgi:uncharacterized membrane protein YebE (DUF533 family)